MPEFNQPDIADILKNMKTIAVVGLSDNPLRPSHMVSSYMQAEGYRIIPVNPNCQFYSRRNLLPGSVDDSRSVQVDMVNIFRKVEAVPGIVEDAIQRRVQGIWMQEGIFHSGGRKSYQSRTLGCYEPLSDG